MTAVRSFAFAAFATVSATQVAQADAGCGALSSGFAGSSPCTRVEERLRVDPRARRDMSPWGASTAFEPLPERDGPMNAHLRLDGGYGAGAMPRVR